MNKCFYPVSVCFPLIILKLVKHNRYDYLWRALYSFLGLQLLQFYKFILIYVKKFILDEEKGEKEQEKGGRV